MASIFVVEDDPDIADLIAHYLQKAGHAVKRLTSGTEVMPQLRAAPPDLVILDLMLPGMDGLLVCQAMRADATTASIPIIMLTARGDEADRIAGLELGADDYVTKPFSPREIVARVRAILRRTQGGGDSPPPPAPTSTRPLHHDATAMRIHCHGRALDLTAHEYKLLLVLLGQPGRVFTRDQLLDRAWDDPGAVTDRTIDAHVKSIRSKLRQCQPGAEDLIQTRRGLGYLVEF